MLVTGEVGSAHVTAVITICLGELAKDLLHTTWKSLSTVSLMTPIW